VKQISFGRILEFKKRTQALGEQKKSGMLMFKDFTQQEVPVCGHRP